MARNEFEDISFSDQLRKAIQNSQVSCYELGRRSGVHEALVRRFLRGAPMKTTSIDKLIEALGGAGLRWHSSLVRRNIASANATAETKGGERTE